MFKRLSILARRPGDDRDYFANRWRAHGDYIARLPELRGYIQNHVVDEANPLGIAVDGIVELWFDTPEAMAAAFASDVAREMRDDEPGFLGRATGYALAGTPAGPNDSSLDPKLLLVESDRVKFDWERCFARRSVRGNTQVVSDLIAKPGQSEPPVPAARFVELTSPSYEALRLLLEQARGGLPASCALFQVSPIRIA